MKPRSSSDGMVTLRKRMVTLLFDHWWLEVGVSILLVFALMLLAQRFAG